MNVNSTKNDKTLTVTVVGSIDTVTAPELDKYLQENSEGITEIIFDFAGVDYISSAGLRVIMMTNQSMEECDGTLTVRNVNEDVMEVFEMTGFDSLLNME